MHLGAVLNHPQGLHVHKVTARPSAHHYGLEMHPDMIVHSPVVGSGISTERAIGVIGFYGGGNSIHNMSFPRRNPCHGRQINDIVQPHVLFLPVLRVVAVDGVA